MTVLFVLLALTFVVWRIRRRNRKSTLAGLDVKAPQVFMSPPTRFSTRLKDHRL